MSLTYGFYNSVDGDRRYDAIQMSSIFDGVIGDGVYETIGDALMVKPVSGLQVTVGTGRAWFNHTWTLNDADIPFTLNASGVVNDRYDAIVLEVDSSARVNSIKTLQGTEAASPTKPELTKTDTINQYPLAYIYREAGSVEITQSDIENTVGTSACPFVIGVVKVMDIDDFVAQWSSQWDDFLDEKTYQTENWMAKSKMKFDAWFQNLQDQLDDNQAGNLQNQIDQLTDLLSKIISGEPIEYTVDDSDGSPIQDNLGGNIMGGLIVTSS